MLQLVLCALASLISEVSVALVLADRTGYTAVHSPHGIPHRASQGRAVYNECGFSSSRVSRCQVAYINTVKDFCLWAPSQENFASSNTEHTEVAWCTESGYETRLIPDGTISWVNLVVTPEYVQVMGAGNFTHIHIPVEGFGTVTGDSVRGLVFTSAYGQLEQLRDWTSFVSQDQFCFRACKPSATASTMCPRIYDVLACQSDTTQNFDVKINKYCAGDQAENAGVHEPLAFDQDVLATPLTHSLSRSSECTNHEIVGHKRIVRRRRDVLPISLSSTSGSPTFTLHPSSLSDPGASPAISSGSGTTITFPSASPSTPFTVLSTQSSTMHSTSVSSQHSQSPTSSVSSISYSHSFSHPHHHSHAHAHHHSHSPSSISSISSSSTSIPTSPSSQHPFSHHSFTSPRFSSSSSYSSIRASPSTFSPTWPTSVSPSSDPPPSSSTAPCLLCSSTGTFSMSSATSSSPALTPSSMYTSSLYSSSDPPSSLPPSSSPPAISTSSLPSSPLSLSTPTSTLTPTSSSSSSPQSSSLPSTSYASQTTETSTLETFSTATETTSLTTSSSVTSKNAQTQVSSQCPTRSWVPVNTGSVTSPPSLNRLMLLVLVIAVPPSIGGLAL